MRDLPAEFRLAHKAEIRAGYEAYSTGDECPYLADTAERIAWRYGWDWADRRASPPARMERPPVRPLRSPPLISRFDEPPDYDKRGKDIETRLVGPINGTIIDAARLADQEHRNGFPNFAMYRLVLAGDRSYLPLVRQWWVLFSIEWCKQRMTRGYSEELATMAAWDSLQRAMDPAHPILVADEVAASLGVSRNTYLTARKNLSAILGAALKTYWEWMEISYRVVRKLERKVF